MIVYGCCTKLASYLLYSSWQEQRKGSTLAQLAFHLQISMILKSVSSSAPQAKTSTSLCRVEQVKDFRDVFFSNARSSIDHFQGYKATRITSFQSDLTAFGHSFNSVDNEVL